MVGAIRSPWQLWGPGTGPPRLPFLLKESISLPRVSGTGGPAQSHPSIQLIVQPPTPGGAWKVPEASAGPVGTGSAGPGPLQGRQRWECRHVRPRAQEAGHLMLAGKPEVRVCVSISLCETLAAHSSGLGFPPRCRQCKTLVLSHPALWGCGGFVPSRPPSQSPWPWRLAAPLGCQPTPSTYVPPSASHRPTLCCSNPPLPAPESLQGLGCGVRTAGAMADSLPIDCGWLLTPGLFPHLEFPAGHLGQTPLQPQPPLHPGALPTTPLPLLPSSCLPSPRSFLSEQPSLLPPAVPSHPSVPGEQSQPSAHSRQQRAKASPTLSHPVRSAVPRQGQLPTAP